MFAVETESGDELYLKAFPSHKIIEYLDFVNQNKLVEDGGIIHATGGGSYKYQPEMEKMFQNRGVKINKYDEMHSLVRGMTFLNTYVKNASYSVTEKRLKQEVGCHEQADEAQILVSIGSGVSIIKVSNIDSFERVSGTMIGGGTLIGLSNLMTGVTDFDEIIELAS